MVRHCLATFSFFSGELTSRCSVLDWGHSAISIYTIYHWCVENFDNPGILVKSPWR